MFATMKKSKPSSGQSDRHKGRGMFIRLPEMETELLRKLAEKNDRTYTAELIRALRKHLREEGMLPIDRDRDAPGPK